MNKEKKIAKSILCGALAAVVLCGMGAAVSADFSFSKGEKDASCVVWQLRQNEMGRSVIRKRSQGWPVG